MTTRRSKGWISKVDKRFGRLVVTSDLGTCLKGETFYAVRCDCGNERSIRSGQLRVFSTCGRRCPLRGMRPFPPAKADLHTRYSQYKKGAKRRSLALALSLEQFDNITKGQCYYCGANPARGVDRIDSARGYVLGNVTPCCVTCNRMKLDLSIGQFFAHLEKIQRWQQQ